MLCPSPQQLTLTGLEAQGPPDGLESFRVEGNDAVRDVVHRDGRRSSSRVSLSRHPFDPEPSEADTFDYSWLRSPIPPRFDHPSKELAIADLFSGCGGLSLGVQEA